MRAFYDLRPDVPTSAEKFARLQHEAAIDYERQAVERAHRSEDERRLARALSRLHAIERRAPR